MNTHIPSLSKLLQLVREIPYIPSKHTYHLAEYILSAPHEDVAIFFQAILTIKENIHICPTCFGWREKDIACYWCAQEKDQTTLCVVETWIDAIALERAKMFQGVYHILGGHISPMDGITPDQLHFEALLERINALPLTEIIIATNQTPEGEATASYIERIIQKSKKIITVSYLATGIPVGTSLEYVDKLTIQKALSFRRKI